MAYNNTFNQTMNYIKEQNSTNPSNINKVLNGTYQKTGFENKLSDYSKSVTKGLAIATLAASMAYNTACGGGGKTGTDENGNEIFAALVASFDPTKQVATPNVVNELGDGATRDNVNYVATLENQGNVPVTITKIGKARVAEGFNYSEGISNFVGNNDNLNQYIGTQIQPGEKIDIEDVSRTFQLADAKQGLGIFYQSQLGEDCEPAEVRVNPTADPKFADFTEIGNTQRKEYDNNGFKDETTNVPIRDISDLCDETLY